MQTLMQFLESEYEAHLATLGNPSEVADTRVIFVNFCEEYLKDNQPIQTAYLPSGLGVRLQQGQLVSFVQQDGKTGDLLPDNSVPVLIPQHVIGMRDMANTQSFGVFGDR